MCVHVTCDTHRDTVGGVRDTEDAVTKSEHARFRDAPSTTPRGVASADETDPPPPLDNDPDRRERVPDHHRRKSMLGIKREQREHMAHREHPHRYGCLVRVCSSVVVEAHVMHSCLGCCAVVHVCACNQ